MSSLVSINEEKIIYVVNKVLNSIKPSKEEIKRAYEVYEVLKGDLEPYFSDINANIQLHGSVEKDTALSKDLDLDIFVLIPKSLGREWIRKEFIKRAKEALKKYDIEERYAEHPYLRIRFNESIEADIVPALKIDDPKESITVADRTPFHTQYVKSRLNQEMRDSVRLLKKFMKGVRVYGAEVKVGGFSGYLSELLVIKYGSFIEVLKEASKWRIPVVVSLDEKEDPYTLRKIFPDASFIFPDPVDPRRNAAAAVREETLSRFILASRAFLEDPSEDFFYPPEPSTDLVKKRSRELCYLPLKVEITKRDSPDNIWGQLHRLKRRVFNTLISEGYEPLYIDVYWNEKNNPIIYLELPNEYCEKNFIWRVVEGPPVHSLESDNFIKKQLDLGEGYWIRENRIFGRRKKYLDDLLRRVRELSQLNSIRCCERILDKESFLEYIDDHDYLVWIGEVLLKTPSYQFKKLGSRQEFRGL
ncbi:MAG: CCA tRNA nucleotidyltransferase [Sulfolobales archaeon]